MLEGAEPNTKLTIKITQKPVKGSRNLKVRLNVTFFPISSPIPADQEAEYKLVLKGQSSEIGDRLGVGLIDPEKTNDIRASFQYFEVEERVLD